MKKLILALLFILCLSFQASALGPMMFLSGSGAGFTCGSELICDDFDGATTCGDLGYTVSGTADCNSNDYALLTDAGTNALIYQDVAANGTVFAKFDVYQSSSSQDDTVIRINNGGTTIAYLYMKSDGKWDAISGSGSFSNTGAWSQATWYTVKVKYVKGTGADGKFYFWYAAGQNQTLSTDTGAADGSFENSNATADANRAILTSYTSGVSTRFDNFKFDTTDPDA